MCPVNLPPFPATIIENGENDRDDYFCSCCSGAGHRRAVGADGGH